MKIMHLAINQARKQVKIVAPTGEEKELTQERLALSLHVSISTMRRIETDPTYDPQPDKVADIIRLTGAPWLKPIYCNKFCELGRKYEGEYLSGLPLSPQSAMLKLIEETKEAMEVIPQITRLLVNAQGPEDISQEQKEQLAGYYQHILDVQKNIEHLSLCMNPWMDLAEQVQQHNEKCRAKRYIATGIQKENPMLAQA